MMWCYLAEEPGIVIYFKYTNLNYIQHEYKKKGIKKKKELLYNVWFISKHMYNLLKVQRNS